MKQTCQCEICKTSVQDALTQTLVAFLFEEITDIEYQEITENLKDYARLHPNNRRAMAQKQWTKQRCDFTPRCR